MDDEAHREPAHAEDVRIGFGCVDPAGLLFYPRAHELFHAAYERFLEGLGFGLPRLLRDESYVMPVVHIETDYRRPLRHGDTARLEVAVERVSPRSFTMGFRLLDPGGEVAVRASVVHAVIERASARAIPLPEPLREALSTRLAPPPEAP